ncbi:MAG: Cna B-type domain-containing protein, partial [Erysipelotrichaceae bacterium]|nr:Cna B-type domain-containing protein [Erysipelotrichaceae bacterium]
MYKVLRNIVISLVATLMLFHSLSFEGLKITADENSPENTTEYVNEEQAATETAAEETAAEQPIVEETLTEEVTIEEPVIEQEAVTEEVTTEEQAAEQETLIEAAEEVRTLPTEYTAEVQEILVRATVAEGTFKEEVVLVVDPIRKGTEEYQNAEETLKNDGADFDDMIAFDIYFKVVATGERIEPDENVKVELSLREEAFAEAEAEKIDVESVNVTHITEANEVVKVADTADETAGSVEITATEEKVEAVEAAFTVESFSTFVLTWKNASDEEEKATIHYGTYSDGNFVEFDEETIVLDTSATNVSIANTFEGYNYLSAVYCTSGQTIADGVDIGEVLFRNGNTWEVDQYVYNEETDKTETVRTTIENGSDIYAFYFKPEKPADQGADDPSVPTPETTKNVTVNKDGTATITLDIVGKTVQSDESHYANVLIILDATASMNGSKWTNAKAAMNTLIETLSEGDNAGNAGKIDYALVTFGRSATVVQNWTKDNSAFKTTCAGINMVSTSGTNWEAGMRGGLYGVLNNYPEGETAEKHDPTYVIFLTDGDPNTWYWNNDDIGSAIPNTRPTRYVSSDNVGPNSFYGASDTYMRPGYQGSSTIAANRAADEAKTIAAGNKLYGIYCGSSGTTPSGESFNRLVNIITGTGQGGQKAIAANADTIESEFKAIAETILNDLGANNVSVDDGVPELSSVSTSVSGAADGFKYYIKEKDAEEFSEWTDHPGTAYSENNGVTWDLGNAGTLKDGTTYRLVFKVWPSQEAYDLIANLNNGTVEWDSLSDDVKSQIDKDGNKYTLKTNTHLNTTYSFNGKTYTDPNELVSGDMPLVSSEMNVRKNFAHAINDTSPYSKLNFYLTVDGKYYMSDGTLSDTVPTKDSTGYYTVKLPVDESLEGEAFWAPENWTGSVYIAPGFMNGENVLETGHKYSLYEVITEGDEYEYEFTPQTVRPMVIDGTLTFLVLKDKYNTNEKGAKEYTIEGETYYVASTNNGELVGTNRKTAELDITKVIVDNRKEKMTPEQMDAETFTYRVKLTVDKDADITGITAYEYVPRTGAGRFTIFGYQQEDDESIRALDDDVEKFSGKTFGAYTVTTPGGGNTLAHVFVEDGDKLTATIDITLKRNEIIRFTNLPSGTQYEIEEVYANLRQADPSRNVDAVPSTDVDSNLADQGYTSTSIITKHGSETKTTTGTKVTGTIEDLDTRYYNQFTNKTSDFIDVELKGTKKLSGYTWITNERYYFNLSANDDEPLPGINGRTRFYLSPKENEVGTSAEKTYSFGKIRFTAPGTYTYIIKEDDAGDTKNGIVYDVAKEVTIVIKENEDKSLSVESVTGTDTEWDGENLVATTTMTNKAEETEVSATKKWKNADGSETAPSGASIVFSVYNAADMNTAIKSVTLDGTADDAGEAVAWTATFSNLPKYTYEEKSETTTDNDGKETTTYSREATLIEYKIKETTTYPGYKADPTEAVAAGETITNIQEAVKVTAQKKWKNADGSETAPAGASVVFTLFADGQTTGKTVELDGKEDKAGELTAWIATFDNLPKYKNGTTETIKYTVQETGTWPGYTANPVTAVEPGGVITNEQGFTSVTATKAWQNADGSTTAPEGATVVFTLYADGSATTYTVTLDGKADTKPETTGGYESAAWTASFVNLPESKIVDNVAEPIVYTVAETTTYPGYTASTTAPVASGSTITNTQEPTTADATKEWKNADGTTTAPEGATVVFTLYADGTATTYTVTLDGKADTKPEKTGGYESEAWKAEFINLPKYKVEEGKAVEIVYTVAETTTYIGYTASTTDPVASGSTITNKQVPTEVTVEKVWENADGTTTWPTGVTVKVQLTADGKAVEGKTAELTASKTSEKFTGLPKYKVGTTTEIKYAVEEVEVAGYETEVADIKDDKITITNKQVPTEVTVEKVWENADGTTTWPTGVTVKVQLTADGKAVEGKTAEL